MSNQTDHTSNQRSAFGMMPDMKEEQFLRWQAFLEERTGMCLAPQRKSFLQTSLGIRMRELGYDDYEDYFKRVTTGAEGAIEWTTLSDRLTVQETRFFRDTDAITYVTDYLQNIAKSGSASSPVEVWSVGCSSGEEVYSLAMLADEHLSPVGIKYSVTGTDLSTVVLRKAREGKYTSRKLAFLPDSYRENYCTEIEGNEFQVVSKLRERTCFAQVNALNLDAFPLEGLNIIYCQNLLIYFRRWRRREILNELAERLLPGGILVTGLGEMVDWQHPNMIQINNNKLSVYVRCDKKIGER